MMWKRASIGLCATAGYFAIALGATTPAAANGTEPRYDRRIEEAAIRMLQPKLGTMRGALDLDTSRHVYPPPSRRTQPEITNSRPRAIGTGEQSGSILHY